MSKHPQIERCYDIAIRGAWSHPFFLIPLGHCEWHEGNPDHIKTMGVATRVVKEGNDRKPQIDLYINTEWVKGLPDKEVFGVLCHEILHSLLRHHERGGGKTAETWGQAADMAINASLVSSGIDLPQNGLLPPRDHFEDSADELYGLLESGEIPKPNNYNPDSVGQGCMPSKGNPNGDGDGNEGDQEGQGGGSGSGEGDGDSEGSGSSQSDSGGNDRAWGELVAQAQAHARGTGSSKGIGKLFKPAPIKTQWERLLKNTAHRAASKGGRDSQTFSRVNRRSFESDFTLPGWQSTRPAISAIIDSSGSVSDEMLRSALSSVKACMKVSGVRVFLALHDVACYYADWISPETSVETLSKLCNHRGGTDPKQAFERVGEAKGKFDACVYLTDGEVGRYPEKPGNVKKMIVGIVGDHKYRAECPGGWMEVLVEVA